MTVADTPSASACATSAALAASTSSARSTSRSAAACRAASLVAVRCRRQHARRRPAGPAPSMPGVVIDAPAYDARPCPTTVRSPTSASAFVDVGRPPRCQDLAHDRGDDLRHTRRDRGGQPAAARHRRRRSAKRMRRRPPTPVAFGPDASTPRRVGADLGTHPSVLFDLLVRADRRDGTRRSHVVLRPGGDARPRHRAASTPAVGRRARGDRRAPDDDAARARRRRRTPARYSRGSRRSRRHRRTAARGGPSPRRTLAELDALVGLAAVKRQVRLLTNLLRVQNDAHRTSAAGHRRQPASRVHRQSGHGQDHGRPPARPDLSRRSAR